MPRQSNRAKSSIANLAKANQLRFSLKSKSKNSTCLICSCPNSRENNKNIFSVLKNKYTFDSASFLLDDILGIQIDLLTVKYQLHRPLSSFLYLCASCTQLIVEVAEISDQIVDLNRKLNSCKHAVKIKMGTGNLEDGANDDDESEDAIIKRLTQEIRRHARQDPAESSEGVERNTGMYLNPSIWTSSPADDRCNFGVLQPPDGLTEPEIIFLPSSEVRGVHLLQTDPLEEHVGSPERYFTKKNDDVEETFSIQSYLGSSACESGSTTTLTNGLENDEADRDHRSYSKAQSERTTRLSARLRNRSKARLMGSKSKKLDLRLTLCSSEKMSQILKKRIVPTPKYQKNHFKQSCGICPLIFNNSEESMCHRQKIHPGLAICLAADDGCRKAFRSVDLEQHQQECHPKYLCPACPCEFSTAQLRIDHIQTLHEMVEIPPSELKQHEDQPLIQHLSKKDIEHFELTAKSKSFGKQISMAQFNEDNHDDYNGLDESMNRTTLKEAEKSNSIENKQQSGKVCSTSFIIENELTKTSHSNAPKGVSFFKCSVCNLVVTDQNTLISHFVAAHNKKFKVSCYVCGMTFNMASDLEVHMSNAHPKEHRPASSDVETATAIPNPATMFTRAASFQCDKCPAVLMSDGGLIMHKLAYHSAPSQRKGKFNCKLCYLRFNDSEALLHHEKLHEKKNRNTNDPSDKFEQAIDVDSAVSMLFPFPCPEPDCKSKFTLAKALECHRIKFHNMPKPIYMCDFCSRPFPNAWKLKRHRTLHTGEKPYECSVCGEKYRTTKGLNNHMIKHTNVRPFKCTLCEKAFGSKAKLTRHIEIHSDARPYLCSLCGKTFKSNNNLYIHMWSHDPDRKTKYSLYMPKPKKNSSIQPRKSRKTKIAPAEAIQTASDNVISTANANEESESPQPPKVISKMPMLVHVSANSQEKETTTGSILHEVGVVCADNDNATETALLSVKTTDTSSSKSCSNNFIDSTTDNPWPFIPS